MGAYALLFPGQGSQYVGMGQDLAGASPAAAAVFAEADRVWSDQFTSLLFSGPAEVLTDTANAQPALFVTGLACLAALQEAMEGAGGLHPALLAGHSLGEYTALAAAGSFSLTTGLQLVRVRGAAMKAAGEREPGGMAAVIGLSEDQVQQLCQEASRQTGQIVVLANDNAPGQAVISGTPEGVRVAGDLARAYGAKRVIPLAVSVAAHSPLMASAAEVLRAELGRTPVRAPAPPVVGNCSGLSITSAEEVVAELASQLTSPIRWTASIQHMVAQGITTFVEVGPKEVLTGLVKRIAPEVTAMACGTVEGVRQVADWLRQQTV
ncbi:MAG: ACP S-malonyltransferase [Anaerolineae bacterium]